MGGTFFVGLTGLNGSALGIRNVGNNLANSNTVGYKATNLFFEELRAAATAGAEAGQGVQPTSTQQVWTQGNIQQSQLATDMSIRGSGFFVISDGIAGEFYTRAGNFTLNKEGKLVTSDGLFVLGYPVRADGSIDTNTNLVPIDLQPGKVLPAVSTTTARFVTNLNSAAQYDSTTSTGETFSTTVLIYDSVGIAYPLTVSFEKTANDGEWTFNVRVEDKSADLTADPPDPQYIDLDSGTITFGTDGKISSWTSDGGDDTSDGKLALSFTPAHGGNTVDFDWELFTNGISNLTNFRLPNATSQTFQDGAGAGSLSEVLVQANGIIEGIFSNGETAPLAQLGLALFTSPQNLVRSGSNLYARTTQSGEPTIGTPDTGGRGTVQGYALELSNVDIAEEFIKLILFQRAYQANSKMITTADSITQQAIQLKQN